MDMNKVIRAMMLLGILLISGIGTTAQQEEQAIEDRLVAFTHQLRMGLTLATVAVHSPAMIDLHLHAQQLVNLLEGTDGRHFVRLAAVSETTLGLLNEMLFIRARFEQAQLADNIRMRVMASAKNVRTYMEYALSAALAALEQRRLDLAVDDMMRAYAFLLAAYEKPCDTVYVPALWTILRTYDLVARLGMDEETDI